MSTVLHDAYDIDYTMTRSCESGQVMLVSQTVAIQDEADNIRTNENNLSL